MGYIAEYGWGDGFTRWTGWSDKAKEKADRADGNPHRSAQLCFQNNDIASFMADSNLYFNGDKDRGIARMDAENDDGRQLTRSTSQIDKFTKSRISFYRNTTNESITSLEPAYTDLPMDLVAFPDGRGNGMRDGWELYTLTPEGQYTYVKGKVQHTTKTESGVRYDMQHTRFPGGVLNWALDCNRTTYDGLPNTFTFHPWIDGNTPDHLRGLDGRQYPMFELSPVDTVNLRANYALSTFAVLPEVWPILRWAVPTLVNKVDIGAGFTQSSAGLTVFKDYQYSEITRDLEAERVMKNISSKKYTGALGVSTRSFAPLQLLLPGKLSSIWQFQDVMWFDLGYEHSRLERPNSDIYYNVESEWEPAAYWKGTPYDDGIDKNGDPDGTPNDIAMMRSDNATYLNNRRDKRRLYTEKKSFGFHYNLPGFMELLNIIPGAMGNYTKGSEDEQIKFACKSSWGWDGITATDNGLFPAIRGVRPLYPKASPALPGDPAIAATTHGNTATQIIGDQYVESMEYTLSYAPKLSDFRKIWGLGYLFYPTKLIDNNGKSQIYIPMEYTWGTQTVTLSDDVTAACFGSKIFNGKSKGMGIGLRYNDDWQFMYRYSRSDNGYNFSAPVHSVVFDIRFAV